MMNRLEKFAGLALVSLALAAPAFAIPTIGGASVDDVTLDNEAADAISFLPTVNTASGKNGNPAFSVDFDSQGTGSWSLLGKANNGGLTHDAASFTSAGFQINFFKNETNKTGTWSIKNLNTELDATVDLVLAMHASNASTAFLFDDQIIRAGQTLLGAWEIEWLNNGGRVPGFSNVAFFARDVLLETPRDDTPDTPPSEVPEPASLALLGLGLLSMSSLRKKFKS